MKLQFARNTGSPHSEVFQRAAEAGLLMALEMGQAYHDVGIGQRGTDLGRGTILRPLDWNLHLVRALESVGYYDVTLG